MPYARRLHTSRDQPAARVTNMHWHGMHVPGTVDGGPQSPAGCGLRSEIPGGEPSGHVPGIIRILHMIAGTQATKGIAGSDVSFRMPRRPPRAFRAPMAWMTSRS